jgi:general secretion pathway protein D
MRIYRLIISLILIVSITQAKCTKINIDLRDLDIKDFIKLTAKIQRKNILITAPIKGKVNLISAKKVCKEDLIDILQYSLSSQGLTLVKSGSIYRVIKLVNCATQNLPVTSKTMGKYSQMVTKVVKVKSENVDYVASKVRHFLSKSAKLVTSTVNNSIIITDYPANIKTIENIIKLIQDKAQKSVELVLLNNIKAETTVNELQNVVKNVFNDKVATEKVEIIANKNINSIMLVGKKENVAYIKNYLLSMDKKGKRSEYIVDVVYLKNAEAKDMAKLIHEIVDKKKYLDETKKPHISVDENSNFIVMMGPRNQVEYIKQIISKLDKDRQQVYIKARIIEVNLAKANKLGVKYGLEGGSVTSEGLLNVGANFGGEILPANTLGTALSTSFLGSSASLAQGLILGISVNMMKDGGAANLVSEPSLLCLNNKESSIYAGETISIITGTTTTTTGTSNTTKREDIGLKLTVKPRISSDNKVTLNIHTVLEDVKAADTQKRILDTTKKEIKTTAILNNGESIIIGGLVKEKRTKVINKVPFLGDIWLLGWLFKYEEVTLSNVNLVVVLTPYIISKSSDLSSLRAQLEALTLIETKVQKKVEKALLEAKEGKGESIDN